MRYERPENAGHEYSAMQFVVPETVAPLTNVASACKVQAVDVSRSNCGPVHVALMSASPFGMLNAPP
jgi:hypothetical protein